MLQILEFIQMANDFLFTSESVSEGHPDKVADQISDAILDAIFEQDPRSRVAAETLTNTGLVVLAGEISANATVDYIQVARDTLKKIGYDNTEYGIDYKGCAVLGILLLRPVAELLGAKGELLDYAVRYGRILMLALPPFALQNMFQSFFVTAEKPLLGFWFTVGAGCTNMVLDVVMVGMLHWGVEGAALATLISQLVGGVLPVFYFIDRSNTSCLHLCKTQFYGRVLWDACINGSSELMTSLSMSLVNILYNFQLLRLVGENGVAAYGVIMYAAFLFVAVFVGYAVGSAPIVSFHYGARNHAEVHNLYQKSLRLIAVVSVTLTAASMVIIPYVARIFVGYDVQLLALTSRAFRLYALCFLIKGFNIYASSFFTALGDGVTSALISFLRTFLFQMAALLLLPALWGIDGVWLAVTAAELATLAVTVYMFVTKDQKFHYRHS